MPVSSRRRLLLVLLVLLVGTLALQASAEAQQKRVAPSSKSSQFMLPDALSGLGPAGVGETQLKVTAEVEWNAKQTAGLLHVKARMSGGWHVYSTAQKAGGPMRSEIELVPSDQFELAGPFQPDKAPKIKRYDFYKVPVEEHYGEVTWTAPIRLRTGVERDAFRIEGRLLGQVCDDEGGCIPLTQLDTKFTARVTGTSANMPGMAEAGAGVAVAGRATNETNKRRTPPVESMVAQATAGSLVPANTKFQKPPADGYRAGSIHVTMNGHVAPAGAVAGKELTLTISAKPDAAWHVYAYAEKDPLAISKPFLLAISEPAGWATGDVVASAEPTVKSTGLALEPEQRYHEGAVDWQTKIRIPQDTPDGEYDIRGMIGYQTCSESRCDMPAAAYFTAKVRIGAIKKGEVPLQFAPGKYAALAKYLAAPPASDASAAAPQPGSTDAGSGIENRATPATATAGGFDLSRIEVEETKSESTAYILALAFVGGFLLNFMPCVLPVIGLKIMSFVQQAGANRGRVLLLNTWYSLGMLSIFWLLALMASAASLGLARESFGWGEQFNYDGFTIPLLCVVFVMGLSFIGVWEIPIPGFVGSGKAGELAQHEGLPGAFFKGIVTTILATPCSGPGLATALTWSATKSPYLVFLVFTFMGLGMALPYLIIGAFPRLIRFLPRPGAWMETFKQLMGFVLMGTVVYMFTLVSAERVVPTLALVFALWAGCWWIGRVSVTANALKKVQAWGVAAAIAGTVGWFAFVYEADRQYELAWEPFSMAALEEHVQARRTVLVDFTADWCPTCKVLEHSVLNTQSVHQVVERKNVVTLVADWSNGDEEIGRMLEALGGKQLPVIAIFPGDDPYRPKKLTGAYTRRELIGKLNQAESGDRRLVSRE